MTNETHDFHLSSPVQQGSWFAKPLNTPQLIANLRILTFIFFLNGFRNGFEVSTFIFGRSADSSASIILPCLREFF